MADITLQKPQAGQIVAVEPQPEDRLIFAFDADTATLTRDGDNLVMSFDDGAELNLTNFYVAYSSENMPTFLIGDAEVSGEDFFAALGEELMPAAGGEGSTPQGSGAGDGFGSGTLQGGVDSLGGLSADGDGSNATPDSFAGIGGTGDGDDADTPQLFSLGGGATPPVDDNIDGSNPGGGDSGGGDVEEPAAPEQSMSSKNEFIFDFSNDTTTTENGINTDLTKVYEGFIMDGGYRHESGVIFAAYTTNKSADLENANFDDAFTDSTDSIGLVINYPSTDSYTNGLGIGSEALYHTNGEISSSSGEALVVKLPDGVVSYGVSLELACRTTGYDAAKYPDNGIVYFYLNDELVGSYALNDDADALGRSQHETFGVAFDTMVIVPQNDSGTTSAFTLSKLELFSPMVELSGNANELFTESGTNFIIPDWSQTEATTIVIDGKDLSVTYEDGIYVGRAENGETIFSVSLDANTGEWALQQYQEMLESPSFTVKAETALGGELVGEVMVENTISSTQRGDSDSAALDDTLTGTSGNDALYGLTGDDTLEGGEGNDVLYGGEGNDHLYGGLGDDFLYGNEGEDFLFGNEGDDIIFAGKGDTVEGGAGNDVIILDDFGTIDLSDVLDVDGGAGMDVLLTGVNSMAQLESILGNTGSNLSSAEVIMLGSDADAAKDLQNSIQVDANGNLVESSLNGWTAGNDNTIAGSNYREFTMKADDGTEMTILVQTQMNLTT